MIITFDTLSEDTEVFDQFHGVRFPTRPRVVSPPLGTVSGTKALLNRRPGVEFPKPLTVEFYAPQNRARVFVGLFEPTSGTVQATLTAFDAQGHVVGTQGPISLGPGPTPIQTEMQVQIDRAAIVRATIAFSGGSPVAIDSVEFDSVGPAPAPDTTTPLVIINTPAPSSQLTGQMFMFQAQIQTANVLQSVHLTIQNASGTSTFEMSFSGSSPSYGVGPSSVGQLAMGSNTLTLSAQDVAGNIGTASMTVERVPIDGTLRFVPESPIIIRGLGNPTVVHVELEETFPGSLAGRIGIKVRVASPTNVGGVGYIGDAENQPVPQLDLEVYAANTLQWGKYQVSVEASEPLNNNRVFDTRAIIASLVPLRPDAVACGNLIPWYTTISLQDLTQGLNAGVDARLEQARSIGTHIWKTVDMAVSYEADYIYCRQTYRVEKYGIRAFIEFTGHMRPLSPSIISEDDLLPIIDFGYSYYTAHATIDGWQRYIPGLAGQFEDKFDVEFKEAFRKGLVKGFADAIVTAAGGKQEIRFLLKDAYVNSVEFGIGFCFPSSTFLTDVPIVNEVRPLPVPDR